MRADFLLACVLFASGCQKSPAQSFPPPTARPPIAAAPGAPGAPGAPSAAPDTPLPQPRSPPAPVLFREGLPIKFRSGPALKATLVEKQAEALALSPDASSWVLLFGWNTAKLVTKANPKGYDVPAAASTRAMFSPDGSHALIFDSTLTVLDVKTGKKVLELDGAPSCAIRFTPDGGLVWHEEAGAWNEWLGAIAHVSLSGGPPTLVGPKRFTRECEASPDGSSFITVFPEPYALVDGKTGRSRVLVADKKADVHVSPAADRYCIVNGGELTCTRIADGGVEQLLIGADYPSIDFDPTGRRAVIGRNQENSRTGESTRERFLADFATATVRRIDGFETKSGSLPKLMPGGQLLAQGSGSGMMVYDLERGQKRFIAKQRLFGAEAMIGHERRFFADAETFGGQDNAELYRVDWP